MADANGWTLVQPAAAPAAPGWTLVQPAPTFHTENEKDAQGNALVRGGEAFIDQVNPIPTLRAVNSSLAKGLQDVLAGQPGEGAKSLWDDLSRTVKTVGAAQGAEWDKAANAAKSGDYASAIRHGLAYAIPIFGPQISAQSDKGESGDIAGMVGGSLGVATNLVAPELAKKLPAVNVPSVMRNVNPAERAAVAFGLREGVPVDAATATGNPMVRGAQNVVDHVSLAGSYIGRKAGQAQADALAATGARLADRASAAPVTAEQAGQGVRDAVGQRAASLNADATVAYDRLRALEQQQAQRITQTGGIQGPATAARPFTNVPLAVDIAPTKAAMQPVLAALEQENSIVPFMSGSQKGQALVALKKLMAAPDQAPLSIADGALSELKSLARVDESFKRTVGQGVAAQAVQNLDRAVVSAARQGGSDVLKALMDGRSATVNKFKAIDVYDTLRAEPVRVFDQLTANRDSAVSLLRKVQREAPAELPKLGRAYLDGLLEKASQNGGFAHADRLLADWHRMGGSTKAMLFQDPQLVSDLDQFFLLAKKIGENPNPSGSAYVGGVLAHGYMFHDPVSGVTYEIAMGSLSKALHSPAVARAMVQGMRVPVSTPAAAAAASGRILSAAKSAGVVLAPVTAEQETAPQ